MGIRALQISTPSVLTPAKADLDTNSPPSNRERPETNQSSLSDSLLPFGIGLETVYSWIRETQESPTSADAIERLPDTLLDFIRQKISRLNPSGALPSAVEIALKRYIQQQLSAQPRISPTAVDRTAAAATETLAGNGKPKRTPRAHVGIAADRWWPNGEIRYRFKPITPASGHATWAKQQLEETMQWLEQFTGLRFIALGPSQTPPGPAPWLEFELEYNQRGSRLYYQGPRGLDERRHLVHLNLRELVEQGGDTFRPIAIHELMHALGLFHELQRADRDEHAEMKPPKEGWSDGGQNTYLLAHAVNDATRPNGPYDIQSVMNFHGTHRTVYSDTDRLEEIDQDHLPIFVARRPLLMQRWLPPPLSPRATEKERLLRELLQRLSPGDLFALNDLYPSEESETNRLIAQLRQQHMQAYQSEYQLRADALAETLRTSVGSLNHELESLKADIVPARPGEPLKPLTEVVNRFKALRLKRLRIDQDRSEYAAIRAGLEALPGRHAEQPGASIQANTLLLAEFDPLFLQFQRQLLNKKIASFNLKAQQAANTSTGKALSLLLGELKSVAQRRRWIAQDQRGFAAVRAALGEPPRQLDNDSSVNAGTAEVSVPVMLVRRVLKAALAAIKTSSNEALTDLQSLGSSFRTNPGDNQATLEERHTSAKQHRVRWNRQYTSAIHVLDLIQALDPHSDVEAEAIAVKRALMNNQFSVEEAYKQALLGPQGLGPFRFMYRGNEVYRDSEPSKTPETYGNGRVISGFTGSLAWPHTSPDTNLNEIVLSGLEADLPWEYTLDGGDNWVQRSSSDQVIPLAPGNYPIGKIRVKQKNADNIERIQAFAEEVQAGWLVWLLEDTGTEQSDRITRVPELRIAGFRPGDRWEYRFAENTAWSPPQTATNTGYERINLPDGKHKSFQIRYISPTNTRLKTGVLLEEVWIDTKKPGPFSFEYRKTDKEWNEIVVSGLEAGLPWEYTLDAGTTWHEKNAAENVIDLVPNIYNSGSMQVRQRDRAGNERTQQFSDAIKLNAPYRGFQQNVSWVPK